MKRTTAILILTLATLPALAQKPEDRGFVHPGGLHTQTDFDRIKQQLADGYPQVTSAYEVLKSAAYAQSSSATYPVESIVRGGSGENYINAARGATIAYQNALRWKIEGNAACAKASASSAPMDRRLKRCWHVDNLAYASIHILHNFNP